MITAWEMYWITRLDAINGPCAVAAILGIIWLMIMGIMSCDVGKDDRPRFIRFFKIVAAITVLAALTSVFVPTTKQAAAIYLVPKITGNEQMQKLPDNVAKFMNAKLDEWIASMTKGKEK